MMEIKTYENGLPPEARAIRLAVFCREQGYAPELEFDEADANALHVVLFDGGEAVATGRVMKQEKDIFYLGRIAVLKSRRGDGLGRQLVEAMMEQARQRGAKTLALSAQVRAKGFYERLGYIASGKEYPDGHVSHIHMERNA